MMKKVDYSLDMLKKIVSGEVRGKYVIENFTIVNITFREDSPWVVVWIDMRGQSIPYVYLSNGAPVDTDVAPLELYIEEKEPEPKPFDKVIAKNNTFYWRATFYSHKAGERYIANSNVYDEVHPWRDCYARYLGTDTPWDQILKETENEELINVSEMKINN